MSIGAVGSIGGGYNHPSISEMRQKMFEKWDTNGDGTIDASEAQTAADNMSQKTGLSITSDQVMSIFDLDQDGSISQSEFTQADPTWREHMHNLMEEASLNTLGQSGQPSSSDQTNELADLVDKIFAAVDTNGDGVISQTEYETALEQLEGQTASTTASTTTTDSSTASSTDTSTTTASTSPDATSGNSLASLLAQFLDLLAKMQQEQYSQGYQNSQYNPGMDYYA